MDSTHGYSTFWDLGGSSVTQKETKLPPRYQWVKDGMSRTPALPPRAEKQIKDHEEMDPKGASLGQAAHKGHQEMKLGTSRAAMVLYWPSAPASN